jgi:hypothetical protein
MLSTTLFLNHQKCVVNDFKCVEIQVIIKSFNKSETSSVCVFQLNNKLSLTQKIDTNY